MVVELGNFYYVFKYVNFLWSIGGEDICYLFDFFYGKIWEN